MDANNAGLPTIGDARTSKTRVIQKRNSVPGGHILHIKMTDADRAMHHDAAEKIRKLIGQKPSASVLLRAGLIAMNELAQQAINEKIKRPDERSKTELNLVHMLAKTACLRGTSD
jgi:hypothetical protein